MNFNDISYFYHVNILCNMLIFLNYIPIVNGHKSFRAINVFAKINMVLNFCLSLFHALSQFSIFSISDNNEMIYIFSTTVFYVSLLFNV